MHEPNAHADQTPARPETAGVAVIVTTYNDAEFLPDALASILAQTHPPAEIIVVDDGSREPPVLSDWPGVSLIRKSNGGLASARNAGLQAATSEFILFLDADDRLRERAIELNLQSLMAEPSAGMAYGAYVNVRADLTPSGGPVYVPCAARPVEDFYRYNTIGMHGAVLYRRRCLMALGGFDEGLRLCEDYDLYLRLAASYGVVSHGGVVAEYRRHTRNVSNDARRMLKAALEVHARYRPQPRTELTKWKEGRRMWRSIYLEALIHASLRNVSMRSVADGFIASAELCFHDPRAARRLVTRTRLRQLLRKLAGKRRIDFGSFSQTHPVSSNFGYDRGLPIDRFYIERFLTAHAADIRGRVLEIGDAEYSQRFGGAAITRQDILHARAGHPGATIVGDLQDPQLLPADAFDCIILTQTLHLLYDVRVAIEYLHAALKPGGVLLATVPGISQIDRGEWGESWYWSFTRASMSRLFSEHFRSPDVEIDVSGNVYAATAFLQGLALTDVEPGKLQAYDRAYPVIIALRARKANHAAP